MVTHNGYTIQDVQNVSNRYLTPPLKLTGDHKPRVWIEERHAELESVAWSTSLQVAAQKERTGEAKCLGHTDHAGRRHPRQYAWKESASLGLV